MKDCLKSEGFHQYRLIPIQEAALEGYMVNMLVQYRGHTLLPVKLQCRNEDRYLLYEISGMESLEQMADMGDMKGRIIWKLFEAVWKCCDEAEEYLLPMEGIRLEPDQIYYDSGKQQFFFCYSPEPEGDFMETIQALAEFCMKHTDHQDSEAVFFVYGLYRILQEDSIDRGRLRQYMEASGQKIIRKTVQKKSAVPESVEPAVLPVSAASAENECQTVCENREKKRTGNYNGTSWLYGAGTFLAAGAALIEGIRYLWVTYRELELKICIILVIVGMFLAYSFVRSRANERRREMTGKKEKRKEEKPEKAFQEPDETTVLREETLPVEVCWQLKDQEKAVSDIRLSHLPGVIGRQAEDVDYLITDAEVSRRHLVLFRSEDRIYAEDLGSTNGTYINGSRLKPGEPFLLQEGDVLKIGANQYQLCRGL